MTDLLFVDWLGRGGIAVTTEALALELGAVGIEVCVVTRPRRELSDLLHPDVPSRDPRNGLLAHLALIRHLVRMLETSRPATVVFQNYLIPQLEAIVHRRAHKVGARVVFVVHDHRLHARTAGVGAGLASLVRGADEVVAHSSFVASELQRMVARPVTTVPLPIPVGLQRRGAHARPVVQAEGRLAVSFGNLYRGYKGADVVAGVAGARPDGWTVAVIGPGAPSGPDLITVDRFVDGGELWRSVEAADATLLPYRFATQSGAVVLAQACGSVPLATAVGGLAEQIEDGVDGVLLAPDTSTADWCARLAQLDGRTLTSLADAGRARAVRGHKDCVDSFSALARR